MRRLKAARQHALPFWQYWNRPLSADPVWALGLCSQVFVLCFCWLFLGGWWSIASAALFAAGLISYTIESVQEYRQGRHEIHDGKDTFRW